MPSPSSWWSSLLAGLAGYGLVMMVAVAAPLAARPTTTAGRDAAVALTLATGFALLADRLEERTASGALGVVIAALCLVLLIQARQGATTWIFAAMAGAAVGLAHRSGPLDRSRRVVCAVGVSVAVGQVVLVARWWGSDTSRLWALLGVPALAVGILTAPRRQTRAKVWPALLLAAAWAVNAAWVGANSPSARWFGPMVSHGPRRGDQVAITFDDGPNVPSTLQIRDILHDHGVNATFFSVGKALDARPDVTAALMQDGDVVANHSYRHDERGWLDPRYPELLLTQRSFHDRLGVCPTFFRPPHGQHTPLMAWVVHRSNMRMVGWDVSAGDWATHDPALVARRVLAGVRGGSIVDLHDGLDGNVTADRSVLVQALPAILDGLAARGLHAVTLDRLLGERPYAGNCG